LGFDCHIAIVARPVSRPQAHRDDGHIAQIIAHVLPAHAGIHYRVESQPSRDFAFGQRNDRHELRRAPAMLDAAQVRQQPRLDTLENGLRLKQRIGKRHAATRMRRLRAFADQHRMATAEQLMRDSGPDVASAYDKYAHAYFSRRQLLSSSCFPAFWSR
jgi:hypothetical protein